MVDIAQDVKDAASSLEARRLALRDHLDHLKRPPGLVAVDDDTFIAAVDKLIGPKGLYPPQQIRTPGGQVITASPWMVMLGLTGKDGHELIAGAGDVLHRIELIQAKHDAEPSP